jgi:hypothetical protein
MKAQLLLSAALAATIFLPEQTAQAGVCGSNACGAVQTQIGYSGTSAALLVQQSGSGRGTTTTSGAGDALHAEADSGYGVYGSSTSSDGVYGTSGTNSYSGVSGHNTSIGGNGVYGSATGVDGIGVYGQGGEYGVWATGVNYGISATCTGTGCDAGSFTGNVYISGTLTCGVSCNSDLRLKQNVKPLSGAVDQLLQLRGVMFEWKEPGRHEDHTGTQMGLIAQDVEKVFPQWVHEDRTTGFKNVDPDARTVLALEVEAFRALKDRADNAEARANALEARLKALETGRRPLISGLGGEGMIFGLGLAALGGGYMASRRKRSESERA